MIKSNSLQLNSKENGFAFVIVLGILLLVTGLALVSFNTADTDRQISSNSLSHTRAYYAAEAGAIRALAVLSDSALWRAGFSNTTIGNNSHYTVEVKDSSWLPFLMDSLLVISTGNAIGSPSGTESSIEVLLAPRKLTRFRYAAFGDTLLYVNGDTQVDAFNSDSAAYVPNGMGGDIGSNDQIYLNGTMDIWGNAGTPDTVIKSGSITVQGTTNNSAPPAPLDSIPATEMTYAVTNSNAPGGLTLTGGASYNAVTKSLTANGGTVTLAPGIYYFSNIDLQSGARFIVPPTGNVTVYTTGNINVAGGYFENQTSKAKHLQIYSTGPSISFENNFTLYAAIYAPNAAIQINGNYDITGSLIGKSLYINGNSENGIHFDRALLQLGSPGKGKYKAVAWKVL